MFYSQFILAKKGPLGTIWIAAHLERKLRKNQVADTDIGVSVDSILFPEVPIALRLSSHLLLGVVRIYSRKVNYLFDDCSEALLKIKQAFRSTAVDLPPEESTAPYHSITLPETFDLDDFELPDNDIFKGNYVDHHVSTREQITLQDTMDGMVYSTSQFGLDERFGDGDTSQIGLDLDEVMLIDKDASLEHDDYSANLQVSHQEDEKKEGMLIDEDATLEHDAFGTNSQLSHQENDKKGEMRETSERVQVEDSRSKIDSINGLPTVTEVSEYAQGPSTPGLEEPNLFGTQVDQVINEADYRNSPDLVPMETTKNESSAHLAENDVIDCSLQSSGKHVDADLHHETSHRALAEVDNKSEEQDHLTCEDVMKDQLNLIPTDHCLKSVPVMDSSNKDHPTTLLPECAGGMIEASDIPEQVEDLHNEVLMNNEPIVTSLDHTFNAVSGGGVNETVASPNSHVTSAQEDHFCKLLPNMDGSQRSEFDGHLEDGNTLSKLEVLNNDEICKSGKQPDAVDEAQVSNIKNPLGSIGRPKVVDVEAQVSQGLKETDALDHLPHETEQPTEAHLRPCTSHLSRPSLSSVEGYKCHEADVLDPALGHHDTEQPSTCGGKVDLGKLDMQFGSQIICKEVGSMNKSAACDMPEPEKLLSLAYQRDGEANDFLVGSTPDNRGISEGHKDAAGVEGISGKKRSYTESTLTVQSMDLVESYGGAQYTRTAESIPDDDDLLSSILAGRRSSFLKIKPSPAAPEIPSTKRFRSVPRTSALKRKVLMDDMMVLHGDTIRHQLTSTEDIRRIRKKAPCTFHEILMIQRQFLEDEIFRKPIFTDLSAYLTIMQNETFDLSGIKVCDYSLDDFVLEKTNNQESYSRTNTDIHGVEMNNEPMVVQRQEDAEGQPSEIPVLSKSHHGVEANNEPMVVQPQENAEAKPSEISDLSVSHHGVEANMPMIVQSQEDAEAQHTEIPVLSESHHGVEANNEHMEVQPQEDAEAQHIPVLSESHDGMETNKVPLEVQPQEDAEAQPAEVPVLSESHQFNMESHNINAHGDTSITSQLKELDISQNAEMNIAGEIIDISVDNCSIGPGHESSSLYEVFKNDLYMPNDIDASLPLIDKTNDLVGSFHTNELSSLTSQNLNTFPIPEDELLDDPPDRSGGGAIEIPEHIMEIRTQVSTDGLEANDLSASLATVSNEANEYIDNRSSFNGPIEENRNNTLGGLNEDQIISSGMGCDDKDTKSDCLLRENTKVDCLHSVALVVEKESSLNDVDNPVRQEAALQSTMCPDVSAIRSPLEEQNDENDKAANDTEFLNVGDDEIIDADEHDDFAPSAEGTHLENSGWSSRTRAVAKYLQTLFDKEDLRGRQNLDLDTILAGKTRKEASRMFFETLVLKTKDYVHAEQTKPFADIKIKPRMKLMKADF